MNDDDAATKLRKAAGTVAMITMVFLLFKALGVFKYPGRWFSAIMLMAAIGWMVGDPEIRHQRAAAAAHHAELVTWWASSKQKGIVSCSADELAQGQSMSHAAKYCKCAYDGAFDHSTEAQMEDRYNDESDTRAFFATVVQQCSEQASH